MLTPYTHSHTHSHSHSLVYTCSSIMSHTWHICSLTICLPAASARVDFSPHFTRTQLHATADVITSRALSELSTVSLLKCQSADSQTASLATLLCLQPLAPLAINNKADLKDHLLLRKCDVPSATSMATLPRSVANAYLNWLAFQLLALIKVHS